MLIGSIWKTRVLVFYLCTGSASKIRTNLNLRVLPHLTSAVGPELAVGYRHVLDKKSLASKQSRFKFDGLFRMEYPLYRLLLKRHLLIWTRTHFIAALQAKNRSSRQSQRGYIEYFYSKEHL